MDTTFTSGTVITKEWLQYINDFVYDNIEYAPVDFNKNSTTTADVLENTSKIQNAIDAAHAAGGGSVLLPGGVLYVNQLIMRASVHLRGTGMENTILKLAPNQNKHLLVDENYIGNLAFASFPYQISHLTLDGNNANNTTGNLLVIQCFDGNFQFVTFKDAPEHGAMLSSETASGMGISNTVPNNRFQRCHFVGNKKAGFYGYDNSRGIQADAMFFGCIFSENGILGWAQFYSGRFSGFTVLDCRFYLGYTDDMFLNSFGLSQVLNNNFELRAFNASGTGYFSCIRITGGPTGFETGTIIGNQFWLNPTTPTSGSIFAAISFDSQIGPVNLIGNYFLAGTITNKRALYGASGNTGVSYPNTFSGFTTGTELGNSWVNWSRTILPANATDLATAITLVNAIKADLIAKGITN